MNTLNWSVSVYSKVVYCDNPKLVAEWCSIANPGAMVSICALSRVRMVIQDGKILTDRNDISEFYREVSEQEAHLWKQMI